jgi:hypothetical protein
MNSLSMAPHHPNTKPMPMVVGAAEYVPNSSKCKFEAVAELFGAFIAARILGKQQ